RRPHAGGAAPVRGTRRLRTHVPRRRLCGGTRCLPLGTQAVGDPVALLLVPADTRRRAGAGVRRHACPSHRGGEERRSVRPRRRTTRLASLAGRTAFGCGGKTGVRRAPTTSPRRLPRWSRC